MTTARRKKRTAKPQPKPKAAPSVRPGSDPGRTPMAVRANLSMLDKQGIAYAEIPQPPKYKVGRYEFHAGTGQGLWRSCEGIPERRGYGVRDLIDAIRDDEAHASDAVAREHAQRVGEAGLVGIEAALLGPPPPAPQPEPLPEQWPPPRHGE